MNIKTRLNKLEAALPDKTEPLRLSVFLVKPSELHPIGYTCNNIKVLRNQGESTESLKKRCSDSVTWSDANAIQVFEPIDSGD